MDTKDAAEMIMDLPASTALEVVAALIEIANTWTPRGVVMEAQGNDQWLVRDTKYDAVVATGLDPASAQALTQVLRGC